MYLGVIYRAVIAKVKNSTKYPNYRISSPSINILHALQTNCEPTADMNNMSFLYIVQIVFSFLVAIFLFFDYNDC